MRFLSTFSTLMMALGLIGCGAEGEGTFTVKGAVTNGASSLINLSEGFTEDALDFRIQANSGIDPTSFFMTIYRVGFSDNPDCSGMTVVDISDDPDPADWVANPELATTSLQPGTYPCVAFEMNPVLSIIPSQSSTSGNCVAGQAFDLDVGGGGNTTLLDGTQTTTSASGRMSVYISTKGLQGEACGEDCAKTPEEPTFLTSPLIKTESGAGQFTVDAQGSVEDTDGSCQMEEPTWGFANI